MTKLTEMDLPRKKPMVYCEKCNHWVPEINKHNRKRHKTRNN